ncbi:MAG: TetR/AcrR family transcriptional regulator [Atopobiaceae bacterium]|nr:TetR/AcrR family transcriptional regulator [Atopobiaceae bacterium]
MTRKEEIVLATLDLAAEYGLRSVSLSQIAERVGIRKPSLYNHFASKDEIVQEAYRYLRTQARERAMASDADLPASFFEKPLEEALLASFDQYRSFVLDQDLLRFWRVLYAERTTSPVAAQIMVEETERMIRQVKALFYALVAHGRLACDDVDTAALSYAMTIHGLVDHQLDLLTSQGAQVTDEQAAFSQARQYISWFSRQMEADHA